MSILEDKIRKNKEFLDVAEPADGHLARFQSRLDSLHQAQPGPRRTDSRRMLRVAAVVALLLGASVVYYMINPSSTSVVTAATLPPELQEAKMYYDRLAEEKLSKIEDCAVSNSEASYIRKIASEELILIDSNTVKLEQMLQGDQDNKRLINALILNYKTKSDLLDDILTRLCHI